MTNKNQDIEIRIEHAFKSHNEVNAILMGRSPQNVTHGCKCNCQEWSDLRSSLSLLNNVVMNLARAIRDIHEGIKS